MTDYLKRAGLTPYLEQLRFNLVGYGCTTCIGNSGPVAEAIAARGQAGQPGRLRRPERQPQLRRPHQPGRALQLPGLAAAGRGLRDRRHDGYRSRTSTPLGKDRQGKPVYLRDIWPTRRGIADAIAGSVDSAMFREEYGEVFEGDERWRGLQVPEGDLFQWEKNSIYVKAPPFFDGVEADAGAARAISGARACWRCSATA